MSKKTKPFTPDEDRIIHEQLPTHSIKWLAAQLHRTAMYVSDRAKELGYADLIRQKALDSRRKPGDVPQNKGKRQTEFMSAEAIERTKATRFQKGSKPFNTKEKDGEITIRIDHKKRNGKAYKWIRVSVGKWKQLHRYLWEQQHGEILKGMNLVFKDGDTMNCTLNNLELITNAELMDRNTLHRYPKEISHTIQVMAALNRQINKHIKNKKNEKQNQ